MNEKTVEQLEINAGNNNEKYKVEGICDSAVYARALKLGHLLGVHYPVSSKGYHKDESTWKPASAIQHFWKLVSNFYKDHLNKQTATSPCIDVAPLMAKCTAPPNVNGKQKYGQRVGNVWKKAKH